MRGVLLVVVLAVSSACSSTTHTWGFYLPPGESRTVEIDGGDMTVWNQGPGSIDVVTEGQGGEEGTPLPPATLSNSVAPGDMSWMGDLREGSVQIRSTSDKNAWVKLRLVD